MSKHNLQKQRFSETTTKNNELSPELNVRGSTTSKRDDDFFQRAQGGTKFTSTVSYLKFK